MSFFALGVDPFANHIAEMSSSDDASALKSTTEKSLANRSRTTVGSCHQASSTEHTKQSPPSEAQPAPSADKPSGKSRIASIRSRDGTTYPVETTKELQQVLLSADAMGRTTGNEAYTRVLTEKEFAEAVKAVVPSATDEEIMDLMMKVDYEAKGRTTWDDFSTFLVSRSRQRSQLEEATVSQMITQPEPNTCLPSLQHLTGTCMEADARRKLLLTGGSEGTVRAWSLDKLESRGVVFAGDSWVVGVHWANQLQCILIVTLDRKLIVLDSKTLEVKRLYRGRAIVDSVDGYMYAHDSVRSVKVGGRIKAQGTRHGAAGDDIGIGGERTNGNTFGRTQGTSPLWRPGQVKKKKTPEATATLATPGTGPYVQCSVEECLLAGLVDAVSCSLFHHSALREDVLLLATVIGEVRFYVIPKTSKRVISPQSVVRLHEKRINKMSIMFCTSALLTASDDGTVKMTSLDTGSLLRTFVTSGPEQHAAVHDFAVNSQLRLLVTVGPERYGIVWDFSHETPMAVLDAHNSPCRCCAVHSKHSQIFTSGTDGSIFIFDTQGYRLTQVLHVQHLTPQRIMYDEKHLRLLCLATHPYFHGRQRHAATACSSKYEGHMAAMVGVMYNKTYDVIVTIDVEGHVMTWKRYNGAPVFTFRLKDFSDSAVMNAARLTCFALDGLERRLLTGFQNGAVAVWNLVNGQTTNVITAAAESFATTTIRPEVTALASLMREGITFFIFAAAGQLFSTRESSTFTIASASKWEMPERFGEVLAMLPVSPQILVCGTSSGALVFYHVLAERQEGSALWVVDVTEPLRRSLRPSIEGRRNEPQGPVITSRVIKMFPLQTVGEHILMTVHADGTVALWHTLRRLLMDTASVRSAFPTNGCETSLSHVSMDREDQHIVFADDHGNIHVCSLVLRASPDEGCMRPPRLPQLQSGSGTGRLKVRWPGSPFDSQEFADDMEVGTKVREDGGEQTDDKQQRIVEEKTPYVFAGFCRDYVFHSGFSSVSGVAFIDSQNKSDTGITAAEAAAAAMDARTSPDIQVDTREVGPMQNKETGTRPSTATPSGTTSGAVPFAFSPPVSYGGLIVVSSGSDNFTRLFTFDGTIIGECGMNKWALGKVSTYEFLGSKPTRRLPPHYCSVEVVDFLQEGLLMEKSFAASYRRSRQARGPLKVGKQPGDSLLAYEVPVHHSLASAVDSSTVLAPGPGGSALECQQGDRSPVQTLAEELLKRVDLGQEQKQPQRSQQSQGRTRFLPLSKSPPLDEMTTLSTQLRSRRARETQMMGLVKGEYISKLRGLPIVDTEDDSTPPEIPSGILYGTRSLVRIDQASESSAVLSGTNNNVTHVAAVDNTVQEGASVGVDTWSSASATTAVGGGVAHGAGLQKLHPTSSTTGARKWAPSAINEPDTARAAAASGNHHGVVFSNGVVPAEDESSRNGLIQEHMQAQRRMLLMLGRKDSVLEGILPCTSGTSNTGSSIESDTGAFCAHLLASRRLQSSGVTDAKSRVAQISSRMRLFRVEQIMPPRGTRAREEVSAWDERMKSMNSPDNKR
ncbi:putative WD40 repeat protein [Trypanosoma grayi]|uniref:putative WD40 repeat protein n=1 Tax=Trypanosoma grayi TaxID=71804 RepID=UPI0004F46624|nr:putative WD40 repeat protein [Trypanosoma grayi]KEG10850.1 putative WD40 repeat protein [Trypanosoma grayi]